MSEQIDGGNTPFRERQSLKKLRDALARLYPTESDARVVVGDAGLRAEMIAFEHRALTNWFNILEEARKHAGGVDSLVAVARADYPEDETLSLALGGRSSAVEGPEPATWRGPADPVQLEKIIGDQSSLVSVAYLEIGLARARSVARIRLDDGSSGTGFLARDDLLITNHHVLPTVEASRAAVAQFNYQQDIDGRSAPYEEFSLLPEDYFRTSEEHDWTAVRIAADAPARWGVLPIESASIKVGDRVNIIQHPGGGYKQLSFYSNSVVYVGANRLQYLTDTLPGSSGAPVFDRGWRLVAIHHSGGWITEPGRSPKILHYRNEGILVDALRSGLK